MNIEELREYCLSLPGTEEKMPFEGFFRNHETLLTFNVGGHIYCMVDINSKPIECTIKVNPVEIAALHDRYRAVGKPYNFSPEHWISVKSDMDMPDRELLNFVEKSYDIVSKR